MDASIIVTYRCPLKCRMCSIWQHPTSREEEFSPAILEKLPALDAVNVTGGEPFVREDLDDIVRILLRKSRRVVFSTNGWMTSRILDVARRYPSLGFRISLEGMQGKNDGLRGVSGGFERGMESLNGLDEMGCRDLGVAVTLSGSNSQDMLELYRMCRDRHWEFATAAVHNSFYFHKRDNVLSEPDAAVKALDALCRRMLSEPSLKSWARACFNAGLIQYIEGRPRPLPCRAGSSNFFIDPYGEVLPCNGMAEKMSMGNLADAESFEALWNSPQAVRVRDAVAACRRNCWMMGTASPAMKSHPVRVAAWVASARFRRLLGLPLPPFARRGDPCPQQKEDPR